MMDVAEKIMAGGDLAKKKVCVAGKMQVFGEKKGVCGGKNASVWRKKSYVWRETMAGGRVRNYALHFLPPKIKQLRTTDSTFEYVRNSI